MSVIIRKVESRKDLKNFIYLPEKIHAGHKEWIPPIYMDEWEFYNPGKNHSFKHCTTVLYLAFKDDRLAGRIMGIINHSYNKAHDELHARMFAWDCYNDREVALALTGAVEKWAVEHGMKRMVGPLGFSDKDPQGLMVEGFHEQMNIATNCSLPYMVDLIEACGYRKEVDLLELKIAVPTAIPEIYKTINNRTLQKNNITVLEFDSRRKLRPYIKPVFELVNMTFNEIYGFLQLTPDEIDYLVNRYMLIINPEFVKVVLDKNRQVVAFALAVPEIAEGIRRARGRLFPFGVFHILSASRKTRMLTMLLGAIRQDYRNVGLDALIGMKLIESAWKYGFEKVDSHLVLETNTRMLAEYQKLGGQLSKRFRIFFKDI